MDAGRDRRLVPVLAPSIIPPSGRIVAPGVIGRRDLDGHVSFSTQAWRIMSSLRFTDGAAHPLGDLLPRVALGPQIEDPAERGSPRASRNRQCCSVTMTANSGVGSLLRAYPSRPLHRYVMNAHTRWSMPK
jgi:hypothetical protein